MNRRADRPVVVATGTTGRLGSAVFGELDPDLDVRPAGRYSSLEADRFRCRVREALVGADVIVNLGGVAHLDADPSDEQLARLVDANIGLPIELARLGLEAGVPMVHVSSTKAAAPTTPYAWSKRAAESALTGFDSAYRTAGLALVLVRPPAMLVGPFDAGRLRRLRPLGRLPAAVVPRRRMPAMQVGVFTDRIRHEIDLCRSGAPGVRRSTFDEGDLATLREVRDALASAGKTGGR